MTNFPLPLEIMELLQSLRPVFHASSWESFLYLITGLLLGQAQPGIVRASLIAPPGYNWRRLHDLMRRNVWSGVRLMIELTEIVLRSLYQDSLPAHLFWVLDSTYLEKVYAKAIDGVMIHHRPHPKAGRSRWLKGHGLMLVAHLYQKSTHRFRAFLLGGLLYLKGVTFVELSQQIVKTLPFPKSTNNVVVTDRGLTSIKLAKAICEEGLYTLGRVKANASFYLPATEEDYKGRKPTYGEKFRADSTPKEKMERVEMPLPVNGKLMGGVVYRGTFLRRGLTGPVDLFRVEVGDLTPWLLMLTDRTLSTEGAIWAYYGRSQIEVAISEAKGLGLDDYRGRREAGVRRWPMVIGVVHSLLQLVGVGCLKPELPAQGWSWYPKETTVGAIQRRLIQWMLRRHFSDLCSREQNLAKMADAA